MYPAFEMSVADPPPSREELARRLAGLSPEKRRALEAGLKARRLEPPAPIPPRAGGETVFPLSFAQQRLWFVDRLQPGSAAYNMPFAVRLAGALDEGAMARALAALVARHETLRTRFAERGDRPVQEIDPPSSFHLPRVDLAGLPPERAHGEADRLTEQDARRPFDLAAGPPFRPILLRLGAAERWLLATQHHIASDGWSLDLFVREIQHLYAAHAAGREPALPALPIQYADYAVWQRRHLSGELLAAEVEHWRQRLAGMPQTLELPTDRPRPVRWSGRGGRRFFRAPVPRAKGERATPFMIWVAALAALLARRSGQLDLAIGAPIAGRGRREVEGLIGFFLNTLVLRVDLAGDPRWSELVARVRRTALDAYAHQELPFEMLVGELAPERSLDRAPLFQAQVTVRQAAAPARPASDGLDVKTLVTEADTAKLDLSLAVTDRGDHFHGNLSYATDLFDATTAERLAEGLAAVLRAAAAEADPRLSELELLSPAERHQLAREWNDTGEAPPPALLHAAFERRAAATPGAVALLFGDRRVTYGELERRSRAVAHRLRRAGAGPGEIVAVLAERSPALVVLLLGVLRAGAAYVALDPQMPAERQADALADAGCRLAVVQERLRGLLPAFGGAVIAIEEVEREGEGDGGDAAEAPLPLADAGGRLPAFGGRVIAIEEVAGEGEGEGGAAAEIPLPSAATPGDLAYAVFTSGSTGRPKGILASHRGAAAYLDWVVRHYGLGPGDTALQLAPATFDAAVRDLFAPLSAGARLVLVAPEEARDPRALLARIAAHGVTCLPSAVPSLLRALSAAALEGGESGEGPAAPTVRLILAAGEPLHPEDAAAARAAFGPAVRLFNQYGASECTMSSTREEAAPAAGGEGVSRAVAAGRPIAATRVHVLDRWLGLAPLGSAGEVAIGGPGLAWGYLGDPARTARAFVPDPLGEAGARLYRTGDLARRRGDGRLDLLGRIDHQLKVRGVRVEPGEIEAVLAAHPEVRQAAVVAREAAPGDLRLVGYVALHATADPERAGETLRAFLRRRLPEVMVPSAFAVLAELPVTPHGKIDREALARIEPAERLGSGARAAPRTPAEEVLAAIWEEVLGLEPGQVGAEDDFFALSGHSLLAAQAAARVRRSFGVDLPLARLYERATLAELAREIEGAGRLSREEAEIGRAPRDRPVPATLYQTWGWHLQGGAVSAALNLVLAARLEAPLDVAALAAAVSEIGRRHEILHTGLVEADGAIFLAPPPAGPPPPLAVPLVDLSGLPEALRDETRRTLFAEERERPFDLTRPPLLRGLAVRLAPADHAFLFNLHHLVSDGWSLGLFERELVALYGAFARGRPSPLPEPPIQYADFAAWQHRNVGETLAAELDWWERRLAGRPPALALPTDRPRPPALGPKVVRAKLELPADLARGFRALARRAGASVPMAMVAAIQALLFRYSGEEDLVMGSVFAARHRPETAGLLGFFMNTVALRTDLSGKPGFLELLQRVRAAVLEAHAHQDVPLPHLLARLFPGRVADRNLLFRTVFNLVTTPQDLAAGPAAEGGDPEGGLPLSRLDIWAPKAKFDLAFWGSAKGEGVGFELVGAADLFDPESALRMRDDLGEVIERAVADPAAPLADLLPAPRQRGAGG